jgi:type I restriction enzyme S subunit
MSKADWRRVKFGDVVRLSKARSQDPLTDGFDRYVGLEHLEPGDLRIRTWGNVVDGVTFTSIFKPGQVLFGKRRAYQRKVAVANFSGVCSGDIYVLESQDVNVLLPELLPFICQTDAFFDHAVGTSAGSLSPRTNWTSLADFEFALPMLEEQKRFLALALAQEGLVQSLQDALLTAQTLKRTTRDHLFSNGLASTPQFHPGFVFPIPCGWEAVRLPAIVEARYGLVDGPFGSNLKSEHYRSEGIPVIQSAFVAKGRFDKDATTYVFVDKEKYRSEIRSSVGPGDIVMVKIGVNCGACARLPLDHPTGILAGNCLKIATNPNVCDAQFLLHYLHWLRERKVLERLIHSTQQKALSLASLKTVSVGIPHTTEQEAIASILDDCDNGIGSIEARLFAARQVLRQITAWLEMPDVR